MPVTEQEVLSALKSCYDPEIPVNIVDLGLIYNVNFAPAAEDKQDVTVDMTLTAQGCPEHVNISAQVKSRLEQLPGIRNAAVNVVDAALDSGTPQSRCSKATRHRLSATVIDDQLI
jgi:metal-sulfur cluster biosynthetic enzyme